MSVYLFTIESSTKSSVFIPNRHLGCLRDGQRSRARENTRKLPIGKYATSQRKVRTLKQLPLNMRPKRKEWISCRGKVQPLAERSLLWSQQIYSHSKTEVWQVQLRDGGRAVGINRSHLGYSRPKSSRKYLKMAASGEEEIERPAWLVRKIRGILLDISGVLYNTGEGGGEVISGSVSAIKK